MRFRIITYNIHKGLSLGNSSFVLPFMREALRSVDPDLLFLQEVVGRHDRHADRFEHWPTEAQYEFLADGVWPHYAYGKNAVYDHGHHGNAILSRYPILSYSNTDLSTNRFESRGMLHMCIEVPSTSIRIHCVCVHLNLLVGGRREQLRRICASIDEIAPHHEPLILAGDFNDWSHKASELLNSTLDMVEVSKALYGKYAATFPSKYPFLRLDRVYVRGFEPIAATVLSGDPWRRFSDHVGLLVECEVKNRGNETI